MAASGVERPSGTVTFLLTDIEGSTRNWEADPSAMREALARHDALLNEGITSHEGHVLTERGEGDSFFAVFERASDAIAAASALQLALHREAWPEGTPVKVRMAIHTGEAEETTGARTSIGAPGFGPSRMAVRSSFPPQPKRSSAATFRPGQASRTSGSTVSETWPNRSACIS